MPAEPRAAPGRATAPGRPPTLTPLLDGSVILVSQSWELSIPGCASLKEKRSAVRSIKDRLRHRFNLSVAETDHQDVHTRAELSVALVTNDRRHADEVLDKADALVAENGRARIVRTHRDSY